MSFSKFGCSEHLIIDHLMSLIFFVDTVTSSLSIKIISFVISNGQHKAQNCFQKFEDAVEYCMQWSCFLTKVVPSLKCSVGFSVISGLAAMQCVCREFLSLCSDFTCSRFHINHVCILNAEWLTFLKHMPCAVWKSWLMLRVLPLTYYEAVWCWL